MREKEKNLFSGQLAYSTMEVKRRSKKGLHFLLQKGGSKENIIVKEISLKARGKGE